MSQNFDNSAETNNVNSSEVATGADAQSDTIQPIPVSKENEERDGGETSQSTVKFDNDVRELSNSAESENRPPVQDSDPADDETSGQNLPEPAAVAVGEEESSEEKKDMPKDVEHKEANHDLSLPVQGTGSDIVTNSHDGNISASGQPDEVSHIQTQSGGAQPGIIKKPTLIDLIPTSDMEPPPEVNLQTDADLKTISQSATAAAQGAEALPVRTQTDNSEKAPLQSVYHVKWIKFKGGTVPIITQNENGPCPLLAIMNVLLLKGKIKLPAMMEMVTSGQLMEYLGDCIFENAPKDISEAAQLNYEQNMHDAMAVFHKLQTGLDVNVKFTGVGNFEYTSECIVFDLLGIHLYHGWLVDPEDPAEVTAIGNCSYNQLVEKVITQKHSNREEIVREALVAEEFLNKTASQLTYHGLSELASTVKLGELCVFFRNNHFSTLYKHKDELFVLVTDQGFLTESKVVWETLSNVEGDGHFVDAEFHTYRKPEPSTVPIPVSPVASGSDEQITQDYLVALSLQQEQQLEQPQMSQGWSPTHTSLSDHELAIQLQEEENQRAAAAEQRQQQQQQQQQPQHRQQPPQQQQQQQPKSQQSQDDSPQERKKSSDCTIL